MSYQKGTPQNPIATFADSSEFLVLRSVPTTKDGIPYIEMWLSPFPATMEMLEIKEEDLLFDFYEYGYLKRMYKMSRRWVLSDNPELPRWTFLCTFYGNDPEHQGGEIDILVKSTRQIETLNEKIKTLEAQCKRLERENFELSVKTKEFFETIQSFTKPDKGIMPIDISGMGQSSQTEVKQKVG